VRPFSEGSRFAFELRALEVCLQEVVDRLCNDVDTLARAATPVFDRLVHQVNKALLETARRIKTQVARLSNKVENVHDELEKLLDSETELLDMCLTRKRELAEPPALSHQPSPSEHTPPLGGRRDSKMDAHAVERDAIEDLENMIEAYFEQIDGAAKKLDELREYISNAEDYVVSE
jgi:magnesium transporter